LFLFPLRTKVSSPLKNSYSKIIGGQNEIQMGPDSSKRPNSLWLDILKEPQGPPDASAYQLLRPGC